MPKNFLFPKTEPSCRNQSENTMANGRRAKRGGCLRLVFFSSVTPARGELAFFALKANVLTVRRRGRGGGGIRTHDTLRYTGFRNQRVRPLCHSSSPGQNSSFLAFLLL